jgi:hypothetical protein
MHYQNGYNRKFSAVLTANISMNAASVGIMR